MRDVFLTKTYIGFTVDKILAMRDAKVSKTQNNKRSLLIRALGLDEISDLSLFYALDIKETEEMFSIVMTEFKNDEPKQTMDFVIEKENDLPDEWDTWIEKIKGHVVCVWGTIEALQSLFGKYQVMIDVRCVDMKKIASDDYKIVSTEDIGLCLYTEWMKKKEKQKQKESNLKNILIEAAGS